MTASFGGVATLPAADPQWGVQDAAGYWTGYSPYSAEEAAALAAKSAADRQAIADYEAAIRAKAGPQELNTAGSFGIGSTNAAAQAQQAQQTNNTAGILPLLLAASAFGGSPTVVNPQAPPVVGETSFSRDKTKRFASGGVVGGLSPEEIQKMASLGYGGVLKKDGLIYTPTMTSSDMGGENNFTGGQTFSGYNVLPEGWKFGDMAKQYDAQGNYTHDWQTSAPDLWDKLGPALAMTLIGYAGGQALMGVGSAGGPDFASGFTDGGTAGGALDTAYATGSAGTPYTTLTSGPVLPNGTGGGVESLVSSSGGSNYVNPKALLDGTNSFGANSAPNALDISALDAATSASAADAAVSGIAKNLGYTGSPASFGGSPTAPAPTTPTAPPAPAPTSFMDKLTGILNDPIKLLGLASILGGAGNIGGGGSGSGGGGYSGGIPTLTASRSRVARDPNRRPGSAPQRHFTDIQYRAAGGLLRGPGTGMSDGIPALIDGAQPARLARDEYVMPADAVSALGDGSSEAGAEELDKLVARIRAAAHGKTNQQRRVNPEQVMPV